MSSFAFFVGAVLPYTAALVFVAAMAYRFRVWFITPQPAKMTLFPAPEGSVTASILADVLFFPRLFKSDRNLWFMSWIFHASLALVAVGHLRVATGLIDRMLFSIGLSEDGVHWMSDTLGGAAGIVMIATGLLLLGRRMAVARVREVSDVSDYFALCLLISIIATGDLMRFGEPFDLEETRLWARSLLAFSPVVPTSPLFLTHALLAQLLIVYIPFSKILHFGAVFFTQALVQKS
jgi:nitrate reductase gamma subunit